MPDSEKSVVVNTTPLIALTAATGSLDVLHFLFTRVVVPYEVAKEISTGGKDSFGLDVFEEASWLEIKSNPIVLQPYLRNSLDSGEAAVIQTAIQDKVHLVAIDEIVGRRIARLSGLQLTGSIGILLKARSIGYPVSISEALDRMQAHGIWLSQNVIHFALKHGQ